MMENNFLIKEHLFNFLCVPGLDGFKICYFDIVSLSVEENYYIIEYESYFNPHANPKQLKDVKKFLSLIDAVNFFYSVIEEHKS